MARLTRRALLITRRGDPAAEHVAARLVERGVEPVVVLTDDLPGEVWLSGAPDRLDLRTPAGRWSFGREDAVWLRRTAVGANLDPGSPAAVSAARSLLDDLLDAFPGFVLDRPSHAREAANKSWQHRVGRSVGLTLPDTLLTASPVAAAAFLDDLGGPAITKLVAGTSVVDAAGASHMPTRQVDDDVRAALGGLRLCPQVFQPLISKHHELRVTVIGSKVSVARLETGQIAGAEVDWRQTNDTTWGQWREGTSPASAIEALLRLMDRAGIQYGAADFIVTHAGEPVFLEVNPWGEFEWLEVAGPRFPHGAWIADVLAGAPGARRPT